MASILAIVIIFAIFSHRLHALIGLEPVITDIYVPNECPIFAKPSDHLLISFKVTQGLSLNPVGPMYEPPEQLFHVHLEQSDALSVHKGLKGMCENASRTFQWANSENLDLAPLMSAAELVGGIEDANVTLSITLYHITEQSDYQLIDAFKQNNMSHVLDLISNHKGVNAMDEWGQTALMLAVQRNEIVVVAGLLNARMPKVNVNAAKSSGYTALFYAVDLKSTDILRALLRRGADPNARLKQPGARDNTPLHFACLLERPDHAAVLLEFGADVHAVNEYGNTPEQLVPRHTVSSVKMKFRRLFQDSSARTSTNGGGEF